MARYVKDLVLNKPDDFVSFMMDDYLKKNQFSMADWKGEPVYRAGDAMIEGYKYLNWSYNGGVLHLEAWLKGSFGGEMDLNGFAGALQKKPYRESLEALFVSLQQDIPTGEAGQAGQPITVTTVDNTSAATQALIFGILTFIIGFISPIICLIFGVLTFNRARMGSGSSKANLAKIGKVLSIIGMVITVILWALNLVLTIIG